MAQIKPFKAIRPAKDKVAFVASRSYEDYSEQELEATLRFNPFSFLHIINPGFKFQKEISGPERFKLVHNRYLEFLEEDILVRDTEEAFYLYRFKKEDFCCTGIFCATSTEDYISNVIKKHEDTIQSRETIFASYLETVGFNVEPVLMAYPDNPKISALVLECISKDADFSFTTPDKINHTLWSISDKELIEKLCLEFKELPALYIADGHHRSASSKLLANTMKEKNPTHTGKESYNYFMSYLIPESEIKIFDFNRLVKDLNGLDKESFLIKLDTFFRIENKGNVLYKPSNKHQFSMYLEGEFYSLFLRNNVYEFTDVLSELDTQILFKTILEPILGILDLRNDKRIKYGYGKHNIIKMKDEIDNGNYKVGFGIVPIEISELKAIADANLIMPPKSTYIEPKLRSGLTIYEF